MIEQNETRNAILRKMMWVEDISYGELHKDFDNHELFNYHLKELVRRGYILKNKEMYSLSQEGRQIVSFMDEDGSMQKQFKVSIAAWVVRMHDNNWETLMFTRKNILISG